MTHIRIALLLAVLTSAICLVQVFLVLHLSNPVADEVQYLTYAKTLAETGQFAATSAGPKMDSGPGREPLYPALLAGIMRLDPVLRNNIDQCLKKIRTPACLYIAVSSTWIALVWRSISFNKPLTLPATSRLSCTR
jgi:hypothetical protein